MGTAPVLNELYLGDQDNLFMPRSRERSKVIRILRLRKEFQLSLPVLEFPPDLLSLRGAMLFLSPVAGDRRIRLLFLWPQHSFSSVLVVCTGSGIIPFEISNYGFGSCPYGPEIKGLSFVAEQQQFIEHLKE